MDNKQSKIVKTAAELLMVYSAQCRCCNNAFDYAAETADTDMVRNYSEITHDNNLPKCPSAASENLDIARYACDFFLCS